MGTSIRGIVVARSRKNGGFCVVIVEEGTGEIYRLISNESTEYDGAIRQSLCDYTNGETMELLDRVEVVVPSKSKTGDPLQPENIIIDHTKKIKYLGRAKKDDLIKLSNKGLNDDKYIFDGNPYSMSQFDAQFLGYSFVIARVFNLKFSCSKNKNGEDRCKASFKYNGVEYEDYNVTISPTPEEDIIKYCNGKKYSVAQVCFSFGHPYEKDGRCHKFLCSFLGLLNFY